MRTRHMTPAGVQRFCTCNLRFLIPGDRISVIDLRFVRDLLVTCPQWSYPYCPRTRSTPSDGLILRWTLAGSRCS